MGLIIMTMQTNPRSGVLKIKSLLEKRVKTYQIATVYTIFPLMYIKVISTVIIIIKQTLERAGANDSTAVGFYLACSQPRFDS